MTNNALSAAVLTAALAVSSQALARAPAPLAPTALVEDVKSASADVEFMDYVGKGQTIRLEPRDVLVLSYLKSCEHETITGGTVVVGAERSDVQGGQVVRAKVPCDGGKMRLTAQRAGSASASTTTASRLPIISFGVPAKSPAQSERDIVGSPISAKVGMSGAMAKRLSLVTA